MRTSNFALQVTQRQYRIIILEQCIDTFNENLMDLDEEGSTSFDNHTNIHQEIVDHFSTDEPISIVTNRST